MRAEVEGRPVAADPVPASPAGEDAPIGRQLADLDDVLAAIELATQTLERTYVDEEGRERPQPEGPPGRGAAPDA